MNRDEWLLIVETVDWLRVVLDEATALERDEKVKAANSDKAAVLEGFIHLEYAPLLEKA